MSAIAVRARRRPALTNAQRQLIEAAHALLSERDLAHVKVTDLCLAAGLARGTFYFHFSSKYSLLALMLTESLDEVHAVIDGAISSPAPASEQRLEDVLAGGWQLWLGRAGLLAAVSVHAGEDPDLKRLWTESMDRIAAVLAERIAVERAIRPA